MSSKAQKYAYAIRAMSYAQGFLYALRIYGSVTLTREDNAMLRDYLKQGQDGLSEILDDPPVVERDAKGKFA